MAEITTVPVITARSVTYHIQFDQDTWAVLEVWNNDDGDLRRYCELHIWRLDNKTHNSRPFRPSDPNDQLYLKSRERMLEMLYEEELIALYPIGPEDKEWFTTEEFAKRMGEITTK